MKAAGRSSFNFFLKQDGSKMHPKPIQPKDNQRSVWDFPRPPILENENRPIKISLGGVVIAQTSNAKKVLETSHPPVYYLPLEDIREEALKMASQTSFCEFKGNANYFDVISNGIVKPKAAWSYLSPVRRFADITKHVAFYAHMMDECLVGDEVAEPQPGNFYGGWVTRDVVGPFKGVPGSMGW